MKNSGYYNRPEVREKERNRAKLRNQSIQQKSRFLLNAAVKSGIIKKPELCPICGAKDIEAHHDDYFKPLEVKWMCTLCHAKYHRGELQ